MNYDFNFSTSVFPSRAGEGETVIPAASIAAVLEPASPLPPEMIAPAWPMRRPGGVGQKHFQDVDEFRALDRIAADADRGGLAETLLGGLEHRLIGQRA